MTSGGQTSNSSRPMTAATFNGIDMTLLAGSDSTAALVSEEVVGLPT